MMAVHVLPGAQMAAYRYDLDPAPWRPRGQSDAGELLQKLHKFDRHQLFPFWKRFEPEGDPKEALAAGGIRGENGPSSKALKVLAISKSAGGLAVLDRLLEDGTLDPRQHAAALAYGALRRRYERSGGPFRSWRDRSGMSDETWQAVKRDHARLIRAAGVERFVLDRLCLDDDAPLSSEVERVRAALERLAFAVTF